MNPNYLKNQFIIEKILAVLIFGLTISIVILPLPAIVLDFLIILSTMISIIIMMIVFFVKRAIDFIIFPNVLLMATIFRLSLNFASTRLILNEGFKGLDAAGNVIKAYGEMFMRGNPLIGVIFFIVLATINFVIITRGSSRMAEVAARFALDALPGKQMSIEADLAAGVINENEAKEKRQQLQAESSFYGAMDGTSKFVRGDAVAGIIISLVDAIGGFIIGVAQQHMSFMDALQTYILLTIGDSLSSQFPAIITSFSAAVLITRVSSNVSNEDFLVNEFSTYSSALQVSSILIMFFGFVPGIPSYLCFLLGGIGLLLSRIEKPKVEKPKKGKEKEVENILALRPIKIMLSHDLIYLVDEETHDNLNKKIALLKENMAKTIGVILPEIYIGTSINLPSRTYEILIKEVKVGEKEVELNKYMAISKSGKSPRVRGIETQDPVWGVQSKWIDSESEKAAEREGCIVVNLQSLIATHLQECIKQNMSDILSFATIKKLIAGLDLHYQKFYEDLIPNQISLSTLQKVLSMLLQEEVSIRDLGKIIEAIYEATETTKDFKLIHEFVRIKLAKQICAKHSLNNKMNVISLSCKIEEEDEMLLTPHKVSEIVKEIEAFESKNFVITAPHKIRRQIKETLLQNGINSCVISNKGIPTNVQINNLKNIDLVNASSKTEENYETEDHFF